MKQSLKYVCCECGHSSPKWLGKCPSCGNWNTFNEEKEIAASRYSIQTEKLQMPQKPQKLSEIASNDSQRMLTGIGELDRVLGGGVVKGSLVLVGGDPGIGKSTLLLQICDKISANKNVLYVSGEESSEQIKIRASRLGITNENLLILAETELNSILSTAKELAPDMATAMESESILNPKLRVI